MALFIFLHLPYYNPFLNLSLIFLFVFKKNLIFAPVLLPIKNQNMVGRMIICGLLFSLNATGQEPETIDSIRSQKNTTTLMERLLQMKNHMDSAAYKKVDPRYIEVPDKPWRVILRYKENGVNVNYENSFEIPKTNSRLDWEMCFEPPTANSIGFWVGYRGTGVSYSKSLTKNAGRYFSFSSTGAKYGFNFRLRRFNTNAATSHASVYNDGTLIDEQRDKDDIPSPVWIRSAYLNGYYVFNGRCYSQSAAYNQAVIQRCSAGSFLLGATWYQSSFDYSDIKNFLYILIGNNIGKIKVHQGNIGFGYGYNLVPFRGFVINAMAMPTISVYDRVKVYMYNLNYALPLYAEERDDYGTWDPETKTWANGLKQKPIDLNDDDDDLTIPADIDMWNGESEISYSWLHFNVDLRLGMAYNWKNYFIGLQGQFNNFSYNKDKCKVSLTDWYARV